MKKLLIIILYIPSVIAGAFAYEVCAPDITATETGYTSVASIGDSDVYAGFWAVGTGCQGNSTATGVDSLCTSVAVGGAAFCQSVSWAADDLNDTSTSAGGYCWCRRTKLRVNGVLTDSIGMGVLIGAPGASASATTTCRANCARICSEIVANTTNPQRNTILLLDSF